MRGDLYNRAAHHMTELKRSLGALSGTAIMVNIVLGAGLFILPGLVAQSAGDYALLYWGIAILLAIQLLITFSLLATNLHSPGGVAELIGDGFGPLFYAISSCLFIGAVCLGLPGIALTAGYGIEAAFGIDSTLVASAITLLALGGNFLDVKHAKRISNVASIICMSVIISLIVIALFSSASQPTNSAPLLPDVIDRTTLLSGLSIIPLTFFAFTGWEVALSLGSEFKRPKRHVPFAIMTSFIIASLLYIGCAVAVLATGEHAFNEAPFVHILTPLFGQTAGKLVALFIGIFIITNLFSAFWGVSRMNFAMGKQQILPSHLGRLTRHISQTALVTLGGSLMMVILFHALDIIGVEAMLTLASVNFLILYGMVALLGVAQLPHLFYRLLSLISVFTVALILATTNSIALLSYPIVIALASGLLYAKQKTILLQKTTKPTPALPKKQEAN